MQVLLYYMVIYSHNNLQPARCRTHRYLQPHKNFVANVADFWPHNLLSNCNMIPLSIDLSAHPNKALHIYHLLKY